MCNDYEQHVQWRAYRDAMEGLGLGLPTSEGEPDLPQADDVRIGDTAPVICAAANTVALRPMQFGFLPIAPPGGGPAPKHRVFNYRSEGRRFGQSNRCLVPASAFFEFTGTRYPKAKHRFTLADAPFMAIAALWRPNAAGPPAFAMLTTAPGVDVQPYHPRQIVLLRPERWAAWLDLSLPEAELLRPLPAGSLHVQTVREASDRPPR